VRLSADVIFVHARRFPDLPFSSGDLREHLDNQREQMKAEIWSADERYLLNTDIEEWIA
jgi:hypothetical protein